MTDEMLNLVQRNAAEAGVANVEFIKGQIEQIPLQAGAVESDSCFGGRDVSKLAKVDE